MNTSFDIKNAKHLTGLFLVVFTLLAIPLTVVSVLTSRDDRGSAAGTATIRLVPATASVNVNGNIALDIWENSGTDTVNAVQVKLSYDSTKFDFVSIDTTGTAFPGGDPALNTGGAGTIKIVGTTSTPVTGDKFVAKVNLRAKTSPGATAVNFVTGTTDGTFLVRVPDFTDVLGTATGSNITVIDPIPTASITNPTNNAVVRQTVTVTADATDNIGVARVDFYLDGSSTPFASDTTPNTGTNTYSTNWNTTTTTNANHTITARAVDSAGGQSNPSTVTVTVDNSVPTVSITAPAVNQVINGTSFNMTATASDNRAVTRVDFIIDTSAAVSDTTSPYTRTVNTTTLTNGNHTLTVNAYDQAGNVGTTTRTFIVDNQAPTRPTLTATPISDTQINLSWTASTDNQSSVTYDVYRNGAKINTAPLTSTTYNDSNGLIGGTAYTYFIRVSDSVGNTIDSLSVSATTFPPPIVGDLNRDGRVNIFDASILFNNWDSTSQPTYDLNGNGRVDIFDASMLFNNWTG